MKSKLQSILICSDFLSVFSWSELWFRFLSELCDEELSWNLQGDEEAVEDGDVVDSLWIWLLFEFVASDEDNEENDVNDDVISSLTLLWLLLPLFRLLFIKVTAVIVLFTEFISDLSGRWLMFRL